jgi:hypothetical protein
MGSARTPQPVKLIASLLAGDPALLAEARDRLAAVYGPIDFESEPLPFDHTDYYAPEHGPNLARIFVTFERLVDPGDLPAIKLRTNDIESTLAVDGKRRVNIDPGYVSLSKLVLASTKNHGHRLYLGLGIYGEGTLVYREGGFRPWPWTYPDYGSEGYCHLFNGVRARYRLQLRDAR